MGEYEVVFNILFEPFGGWWLGVFVLFGLIIGAGAWALGERQKVCLAAFGALFVVGGLTSIYISWRQYADLQRAFRAGETQSIEGVVRYSEMGRVDRFEVEGERFELWSRESAGYNRRVKGGGANLEARCVRIYFIPSGRFQGNDIVWLGIRKSGCPDS